MVDALPFIAAVYVVLMLVYRTLIRTRPDAFVALQYGSIVLDPALTVLAIAAMPTVLGLVATSLCCWSKACRRTTAAHSTQHTAAEVGPSVLVSASVGVHCWAFANQPSANEIDLIEIADCAMYAAKRAGKSRVVLSAGQLVSD